MSCACNVSAAELGPVLVFLPGPASEVGWLERLDEGTKDLADPPAGNRTLRSADQNIVFHLSASLAFLVGSCVCYSASFAFYCLTGIGTNNTNFVLWWESHNGFDAVAVIRRESPVSRWLWLRCRRCFRSYCWLADWLRWRQRSKHIKHSALRSAVCLIARLSARIHLSYDKSSSHTVCKGKHCFYILEL